MGRRGAIVGFITLALVAWAVPADAGFPREDSRYHDFAELRQEIKAIADKRPHLVDVFSIGESAEGRKLWAATVSQGDTPPSEKGVLFVGGHHAREHMSVEVTLGVFRMFVLSADPDIRDLVRDRQIHFVFNLNPDGSEFDINGAGYRSWRKTRQPNAGRPRKCWGTDLNRNYSYEWASGRQTLLTDPCSDEYQGKAAFSAPESDALRDFVDAHPEITAAASYHSYGGEILYPFGYTPKNTTPDMDADDRRMIARIAKRMAKLSNFQAMQSGDKYKTPGDFIDWMWGAHGAVAYTVELSGNTFYPADERIRAEIRRNVEAAVYLAKVAACPTTVIDVACP